MKKIATCLFISASTLLFASNAQAVDISVRSVENPSPTGSATSSSVLSAGPAGVSTSKATGENRNGVTAKVGSTAATVGIAKGDNTLGVGVGLNRNGDNDVIGGGISDYNPNRR